MAQTGTLAELFVQITTKGVEVVQKAMTGLTGQLASVAEWGKKIQATFTTAFKAAGVSVLGLVTAGMAGTVEGNRMAFAWQQLGRQLAAIVLPVFEAVNAVVWKVTGALKAMSGDVQGQVLAWGGLAAGVGMVWTGIGTLPGIILIVVSSIKLLTDAFEWVGKSAGGAMSGVKDGFLAVVGALGKVWSAIQPVLRTFALFATEVVLGPALQMLGEYLKAVGAVWSWLADAASTAWTEIEDVVGDMLGQFAQLYQEVQATFKDIGSFIADTFMQLKPVFELVFGAVVSQIKMIMTAVTNMVAGVRWAIRELKEIWNALPDWLKVGMPKQFDMSEREGFDANQDADEGGGGRQKRQLTPAGGGFESITSSYARIQGAVSKTDPMLLKADQQIQATKEVKEGVGHVARAMTDLAGRLLPQG